MGIRVTSILLAAWLGAGTLFATVVAPSAFAVLPSRLLAGALVGRVLPVLFLSGIVAAAAGLALDRRREEGRMPNVRRTALAVMMVACAIAQFVVAPRIERIRNRIEGPIEQLSRDDPRRVAFGRLHAVSVGWLGLAMLGGATAIVLASMSARTRTTADARARIPIDVAPPATS